MTGAITVTAGTGLCHLPAPLLLELGGVLLDGVLAWERQGRADAPAVVVLGGISAGRHLSAHAAVPGPGWWEGVVGAGLGVDTERCQVLSIDWLGGAGASSGPRTDGPAFPQVTVGDQASALAALLDELGIARLHALVGASFGGMVGLAFAARFPERVGRLCCIAAAEAPHPMATAFRSVQRQIVTLAGERGRERDGVVLARALAMATYRGRPEFAARFRDRPGAVADYLLARGEEFADRFPAAAFVALSAAIDRHRVSPEQVQVPTWLFGFDTDQIVPPEQLAALAARLPRLRRHRVLASRFGHDGFLKETAQLRPLLREVLA